MDAQDILQEAVRAAGLAPKNAKNVLDLVDRTRAKGPLKGTERSPTSGSPVRRTGFFASLRGPGR
ncbi:MAG TPA: hypothetical protein VG294_09105 [Solirubrobacteraceae bacterium]|jgi:hypothetical protein|nr:hypothetical protein [Solirubrobacteraceae bacterium]